MEMNKIDQIVSTAQSNEYELYKSLALVVHELPSPPQGVGSAEVLNGLRPMYLKYWLCITT